jgi:Uma2 family endonuclease
LETQAKTQVARRRFTVHEYHRMAEAGILHEDDQLELIEGEIVEMTPIGSRHAACVIALDDELPRGLGRGTVVISVRNPVRLGDDLEPEPDVAMLRLRGDGYRRSLPTPEDVLLLIEVSDTSLSYDRNVKLPLYARARIPEVWIVDLANETIERHTEPAEEGYRLVRRARRGETLESKALPALALTVDAVLG